MWQKSANAKETRRSLFFHFTPFLLWWPEVTRKSLKADSVAGLIGAIIALPQGVAFAAIAGLPPQYGIFCSIVPVIIAALFGSSRLLICGPTTAVSLMLFSTLSFYAAPETPAYVQLVLEVTLLVGLIQLGMGLAGLGSLVNFISHSVITGFTMGAAMLIFASQTKNFLGLDFPPVSHFQDILANLFLHRHEINPYTVVVGITTLLVGIIVKHFRPSWPYMIFSIAAGGCLGAMINHFAGQDTAAISVVGALPQTLPSLTMPHIDLENIRILFPIALSLALLGLTEAISIARVMADRSGNELDGNQEFIGQGLSNLIGSFLSCYTSTGSFNRSGMNFESGAKTPLAAIISGLVIVPFAIFFAPLAQYLPKVVLSAILYQVAWNLLDLQQVIRIVRTSRTEAIILGTTFISCLLLEMHFAILLGILVSLTLYLNRTSHPHVLNRVPHPRMENRAFTTDPCLPECPQLKIIRIDGSLYFGAVAHVRVMIHSLLDTSKQPHLLLICSGINFIDLAGAEYLAQLATECKTAGGNLYFYDLKEDISGYFRYTESKEVIGEDQIFTSKRKSLSEIFNLLDHSICARCTRRIFWECETVPFTSAPLPETVEHGQKHQV